MGARTHIRHVESGAVREVASSALRMLVRSGWQELSEDEVAALHEERRAERAAAEAAMTPGHDQAAEIRTSVSVDAATENSAAPEGDGGEHDDTAPELGRRQDTEQESD